MNEPCYVVITPVRDEVDYVGLTFQSMISQTIKPAEWIIVDDGSKDGTGELLDKLSRPFPWVKVIHRPDRGFRNRFGGEIEAFSEALSFVKINHWEFIVKLDGDVSFDSEYFEHCLGEFLNDPKLGIGGGTVYVFKNNELIIDSPGDPPFHVRGATKIYRRACWDNIKPLVQGPGWDTIDEVKANYFGWSSRSFPQVKIIQHKPTGSSDETFRNWFNSGLANYHAGYHPIFMWGKCLKRVIEKPFFIASLGLMCGFISGYLKGITRSAPEDVVAYLRREQLNCILGRLSIYTNNK